MTSPAASASREAARRRAAQRRGARAAAWLWVLGVAAVVVARPAPPTAAAVVMGLTAVGLWMRRDQGADRWGAGAAGERRTADALARLGPGWVVVHDVVFAHTRANVDHVVVGPRGCVVIDSKQWREPTRVGVTSLRVGGRPQPDLLERQWWYVDLVRRLAHEAVGHPVDAAPLLAVHGAPIRRGLLRRRRVAGVWVGDGTSADVGVRRVARRLHTTPRLTRRERRWIAQVLAGPA